MYFVPWFLIKLPSFLDPVVLSFVHPFPSFHISFSVFLQLQLLFQVSFVLSPLYIALIVLLSINNNEN